MTGKWRSRPLGLVLLVFCVVGSPAFAAAAEEKMDPSRYVTQEQLDERGPYKIEIREVGRFEIQNVAVRSEPKTACAVELASVETAIRRIHKRGGGRFEPNASLSLSFEKTGCYGPNGEVLLCCKGDGSACTVDVGILAVE